MRLYSRYKTERDIRSVQRDSIRDPRVEEEILSSIEPAFFQYSDPSDCEDFVAQRLPDTLDVDFIISEKNRLKRHLAIVSRKVTDLMTRHQSAYFGELQRVISLQHAVNDCINTCAKARSCLATSRNSLTVHSLKVVAGSKRRDNLVTFLHVISKESLLRQETSDTEDGKRSQDCLDEEAERFATPESASPVKQASPFRSAGSLPSTPLLE